MSAQKFYRHDQVTVNGQVRRKINAEDRRLWQESDASKGMNSAGETKLQWPTTGKVAGEGEVFTVYRGRARFANGWGNPTSGWVKLLDADGQVWFAKESDVSHV